MRAPFEPVGLDRRHALARLRRHRCLAPARRRDRKLLPQAQGIHRVGRVIWLLVLLGVVLLLVVLGIVFYNRLVRLRNRVDNSWAQIEVQLKRRWDLIPNLVETVKGYAAHERETFEAVTAARAGAQQAQSPGETAQAEGILGQALGRLFAVAEAYPELQADENFRQLQSELAETENRIAVSRPGLQRHRPDVQQRDPDVPRCRLRRPARVRRARVLRRRGRGRSASRHASTSPADPQAAHCGRGCARGTRARSVGLRAELRPRLGGRPRERPRERHGLGRGGHHRRLRELRLHLRVPRDPAARGRRHPGARRLRARPGLRTGSADRARARRPTRNLRRPQPRRACPNRLALPGVERDADVPDPLPPQRGLRSATTTSWT